MKKHKAAWMLILAPFVLVPATWAQKSTQTAQTGKQNSGSLSPQNKNIQEYIDLLRSDVRQQKAEIMGSVMQLSASDAAKFWPIYSEYDTELIKLNDLRAANIQEYAKSYTQLTDEKADELIQKAAHSSTQRRVLTMQISMVSTEKIEILKYIINYSDRVAI